MSTGKARRLARIFRHGKSVLIPMDHGVSAGPLPGLGNMRRALAAVLAGGADAVVGHRLLFRELDKLPAAAPGGPVEASALLHLSASTDLSPSPNRKALTASVEDALRLGADGVSIHVNIGDPDEASMLADFGRVARAAADWGMPLLAMLYARGPKIKNGFDPDIVAHCARIGAELGADAVKVLYTGDAQSFRRVTEGCAVPVLVAGGPQTDSPAGFFRMLGEALQAGAAGVSIGRNVFQHPRPERMAEALRALVHEGRSPEQALALTLDAHTANC
jgi:class I fructose-bisphosphate aldolase